MLCVGLDARHGSVANAIVLWTNIHSLRKTAFVQFYSVQAQTSRGGPHKDYGQTSATKAKEEKVEVQSRIKKT